MFPFFVLSRIKNLVLDIFVEFQKEKQTLWNNSYTVVLIF